LTIKTEIPAKQGSIHHFPQVQNTATEKRIQKYALVEEDMHKETFHSAITLQISSFQLSRIWLIQILYAVIKTICRRESVYHISIIKVLPSRDMGSST
jgi:hypothetical protein